MLSLHSPLEFSKAKLGLRYDRKIGFLISRSLLNFIRMHVRSEIAPSRDCAAASLPPQPKMGQCNVRSLLGFPGSLGNSGAISEMQEGIISFRSIVQE